MVRPNLYGDILSDVAAEVAGSIGEVPKDTGSIPEQSMKRQAT